MSLHGKAPAAGKDGENRLEPSSNEDPIATAIAEKQENCEWDYPKEKRCPIPGGLMWSFVHVLPTRTWINTSSSNEDR
jgi:hypothetical protein